MKKLRNTDAELKKNVLLIKHKRVRQKTKTLKRRKSTETVLNQPLLKDAVTRKLRKSNQLGTSILFGIANELSCFKNQFFVCIDNFEQYFQASILETQNDLECFIITWKVFTPLKNNRLKLSVVFGLLNMLYGKKPQNPETLEINRQLCKAENTHG